PVVNQRGAQSSAPPACHQAWYGSVIFGSAEDVVTVLARLAELAVSRLHCAHVVGVRRSEQLGRGVAEHVRRSLSGSALVIFRSGRNGRLRSPCRTRPSSCHRAL